MKVPNAFELAKITIKRTLGTSVIYSSVFPPFYQLVTNSTQIKTNNYDLSFVLFTKIK